jgi:hypothetical protein
MNYRFIRLMSTERTLYKYLVWPMGFSLRQANLFMCKARAISRTRRAAPFDVAQGRESFDFAQDRERVERLVERGNWNNIPGPEAPLSSQKLPARLGGTLCYYFACKFFAAAKRAPWAQHHQSCYSFIIKCTYSPDDPNYLSGI